MIWLGESDSRSCLFFVEQLAVGAPYQDGLLDQSIIDSMTCIGSIDSSSRPQPMAQQTSSSTVEEILPVAEVLPFATSTNHGLIP